MSNDGMVRLANSFKMNDLKNFKWFCKSRSIVQKYQILAVLWDNKEHSFEKLNAVCYRYGSYINIFKELGIIIVNRYNKEDGKHYYRLLTDSNIINLNPIGVKEGVLI